MIWAFFYYNCFSKEFNNPHFYIQAFHASIFQTLQQNHNFIILFLV
ncbi:hypothetical protein bcere0026_22110 [Bacillus mycoides]|uniref:Uncharacterized protein n=1 Tax=Bacillus mycoides TaxID=1405 RepID=C2XU40_BACMY|nr:hypothetical protein bcere0026_22110 [Bacillus mycoides]